MNYRAEANRLAGCKGMDDESFFREIHMALQNAAMAGRIDAYNDVDAIGELRSAISGDDIQPSTLNTGN